MAWLTVFGHVFAVVKVLGTSVIAVPSHVSPSSAVPCIYGSPVVAATGGAASRRVLRNHLLCRIAAGGAIGLSKENLTFPSRIWNTNTKSWEDSSNSDGWGERQFEDAEPDAGSEWTDDGNHRDRRHLKHRAKGESRTVPMHPELVTLPRDNIENFGIGRDGQLFIGVRGGELPTITYRRAWLAARKVALTAEEQKSPLGRRVYDFRHACLSMWLNAGVHAPGRGVGRAWGRRAAQDLRQVHRRPA